MYTYAAYYIYHNKLWLLSNYSLWILSQSQSHKTASLQPLSQFSQNKQGADHLPTFPSIWKKCKTEMTWSLDQLGLLSMTSISSLEHFAMDAQKPWHENFQMQISNTHCSHKPHMWSLNHSLLRHQMAAQGWYSTRINTRSMFLSLTSAWIL